MTPQEITALRERLGLTQAQLAELLGLHPMTVSKFERGVLTPSDRDLALMRSFERAGARYPGSGARAFATGFAAGGIASVLFLLLRAAFSDEEKKGPRKKKSPRASPAKKRRTSSRPK